MSRMVLFDTRYWSARLPDDWLGHHEGIGAGVLHRETLRGVLQITGVPKGLLGEKREVTDDDLLEFARDDYRRLRPTSVRLGVLTGFHQQRVVEGVRWSYYWLGHGALMVFATYIVALRDEDETETAKAEEILASLRPK